MTRIDSITAAEASVSNASFPVRIETLTPGPEKNHGDRLISFDALRGVAILLVIGHHAAFRFPPDRTDFVGHFLKSVGWIGVDVFFALSGYLIVSILRRDALRHDIKGFFRRRFFRIVPIFALAMVVFVVSALATHRNDLHLDRTWITTLFLNGWLLPVYGIDGLPFKITWSLSVEEFAYLVLGLSAAASVTLMKRVVFACLAVAICVRLLVLLTGAFDPSLLYFFVPARLDAIALGAFGALGYYDFLTKKSWSGLIAGMLTIALMIAFQWTSISQPFLPMAGYSIFGLVCSVWVASLAKGVPTNFQLIVGPLAKFGKISYFIYLFHIFVLEAILALVHWAGRGPLPFWAALGLAIVICYATASVSWKYIEGPLIQRSKSRLISTSNH